MSSVELKGPKQGSSKRRTGPKINLKEDMGEWKKSLYKTRSTDFLKNSTSTTQESSPKNVKAVRRVKKLSPPSEIHLSFPRTFKKEKASNCVRGSEIRTVQMNQKKRRASTKEHRGLRQAVYHCP